MPIPPDDHSPLTADEVMISRAIRELLITGGHGTIVLIFKKSMLEELQVTYTKKARLERADGSGQRLSD